MKKIILAILFLVSAQVAVSQTTTSVVGRIIDAGDKSPVPFATVAVYSAKDTSLIGGAMTADNGTFTITRIPKGDHIFRVSFVGYTTLEKPISITDLSKPLAMGRVEFMKGVELKGFEITETFIPVQIKEDTVEFNAEAFRPVEGSALEELLKRLPGVEIDSDGKITIKGKEVTSILVDGEKFFSDDPKVAAKNIPADYVQTVQSYDRRSEQARFTGIDDGNEETVLNLSFKPGMKKGWFGRLTAGGGMDLVPNGDFRYDNNINLNYFRDRDQLTVLGGFNNVNNLGFSDFMGSSTTVVVGGGGGGRGSAFGFGQRGGITQSLSPGVNFVKKYGDKLSIGGSYSYSRSDRDVEQNTYRENILSSGSQYYEEDKVADMLTNQHRFNAEIKYTPNEDNELMFRPSISYGTTNNWALSEYVTMADNLLDTINRGLTENLSTSTSTSVRLRTDYRRRLGKPRRTISFELDGSYNNNSNTDYNDYWTDYYNENQIDTTNQRIKGETNRYSWSAQAAYTEPLIWDYTLELRYTISGSEDNTKRYAYNLDANGEYTILDPTYTNDYGNTYFNQRIEARIQKSGEKYRYSFGLGIFPANSTSYVEGVRNYDTTTRVYNFAPQLQYVYNFSKQHALNIRYSGRTNQPSVSQLQPVADVSDPLNIRVGNAALKPEFRHSLFATYNNFFPNYSSIFSSLMFNMTQNSITNATYYNEDLLSPETAEIIGTGLGQGARVTISENAKDPVFTSMLMISYSTPIFSQKITLSSTSSGRLNSSQSIIDAEPNKLNSLALNENLRVTYRLERFDVSLNGRIQWNDAKYSLNSQQNSQYYTTSGGADFNWQIIKSKLVLSSDLSFQSTTGYADGYNPKYTTWNAQLAWNLGRANDGQLRLRVADILNDNKNTQRTAATSYIEDITYKTLRRYFIVSLTYNLNSAKRGDAPEQEGVGRTGGPRPPAGMPAPGSPGGPPVIIRQ